MNKEELRIAWIEALESGKYEQGRIYLNDNGKFCCLGVLCDILVKNNMLDITSTTGGVTTYSNAACVLPHKIVKLIGLYSDTGELAKNKFVNSLVTLNDTHKMNFKGIAAALKTGDYWD